jgi:hypothetical protein
MPNGSGPLPAHSARVRKRKGNAHTMPNGSGPLAWPIPFPSPTGYVEDMHQIGGAVV